MMPKRFKFRQPIREHICSDCGCTFASAAMNVLRCPECRKPNIRRRTPPRACGRCGEAFQPVNSRHAYCCKKCREAAFSATYKPQAKPRGRPLPVLPPVAERGYPTPAEIAAACEVIRAGWTAEDWARRGAGLQQAVEFLSAVVDRHRGRAPMLARGG